MNFEEYRKAAMRTSPEGHDRVKNALMGLVGESGEIVDLCKKWEFQSGENPPLPRERMLEELGDVMWYAAELMTGAGLTETYDFPREDEAHPIQPGEAMRVAAVSAVGISLAASKDFWAMERRNEKRPDTWQLAQTLLVALSGAEMIAMAMGSTLEATARGNIEKLKARYPNGFDPERSLNRG